MSHIGLNLNDGIECCLFSTPYPVEGPVLVAHTREHIQLFLCKTAVLNCVHEVRFETNAGI